MNVKKLRLGLIGKDVSNSSSGQIHTFILKEFGVECDYQAISVSSMELPTIAPFLLGDFDGFNVTIPYKREMFSYIDDIGKDAFDCGAVNTVVCATRTGYNTDGVGFMLMLETNGICVKNKKVCILGLGGAGRSIAIALKNAGARVYAYRRDRQELEEICNGLGVSPLGNPECGGFDIVINCTGVGMHDTVGVSPVSEKAFVDAEWAVDLIYRPQQSEFLRLASENHVKTLNGAAMLFYQAYYADCLYLGLIPTTEQAKSFYEKYLKELK